MTKPVTIGSVQLPVNSTTTSFVPKDVRFVIGDQEDQFNAIAAITAIEDYHARKPVLLIGPTGCGKTTAVKKLAEMTNNSYRRLQLTGQTDVDDLVGRYVLKAQEMVWQDGILIQAMREGHWLLLDEINAALPDVLFALHSVMDHDNSFTLSQKDGEVVNAHENFRIFASMNPPEGYAGTKELNRALLDRFIPIIFEYPTQEMEVRILDQQTPLDDTPPPREKDGILTRMVRVGQNLRKLQQNEKSSFDFECSTRNLLDWANLFFQMKDIKLAAKLSLYNRCMYPEDAKQIENEVNKEFKGSTSLADISGGLNINA